MKRSINAMYGEKGKPVIVCSMRLIVVNASSRNKPLSQKPVCQSSHLYKRWRTATFSVPTTIGWMPYWMKRKKAKPIGGM